MNLTAFKMCGLILTPYLIKNYKDFLSSTAVRLMIVNVIYLGILGLIFGHLAPWVDPTGLKGGRDVPQWRSVIHLGSMGLELFTTLYLAKQFQEIQNILLSLKTLIFGALGSAAGAVMELLFQFDFYGFFTHQAKVIWPGRMKGFNYEPRGFAQCQAYGIILSLFFIRDSVKIYFSLITIFLLSIFYLSMSTTGIIVLAVGLIIPFLNFFYDEFKNKNYKKIGLILAAHLLIFTVIIAFTPKAKMQKIKAHHSERNFIAKKSSIVSKLEVFDAAAANFLIQNPKYLIFGTGPGLVSIPVGKEYLLDRDKNFWSNGIVALPHMGAMLMISNGGLIGLALWIAIILICIKSYFEKHRLEVGSKEKLVFLVFLTLVGLYLIQIRYLYYIGLAIGLSFTFNSKSSDSIEKHS